MPRREASAARAAAAARADAGRASRPPRQPPLPRGHFALYSLLPALVLFASAELAVRLAGLDGPTVRNIGLPEEQAGLLRMDPDVFWALRPGLDVVVDAVRVQTNAHGLRSPLLGARQPGELRILSLGESTTFGVGVGNDDTYTSVLGRRLGAALQGRPVTTLNAGVSAWSSFQSRRYLESRGLDLEPDLVLVYHEINDYLPSTLRDSSDNEIGALQTDRQLHDSRADAVRRLLTRSALYRFLAFRHAAWQLERYRERHHDGSRLGEVGLPAGSVAARLRLVQTGGEAQLPAGGEAALGRRVSDEERRDNLAAFAELCSRRGARLVLIHPSYRDSIRHECLLTRFARETGTPVFEAHDVLHPVDLPTAGLFRDSWHPSVEGHRRLGEGLAEFLVRRELVPVPRAMARGREIR